MAKIYYIFVSLLIVGLSFYFDSVIASDNADSIGPIEIDGSLLDGTDLGVGADRTMTADKLKEYVERLVSLGQVDQLKKLHDVYVEQLQKQRMDECVKRLGSRAVCNNGLGFRIWAQSLARNILKGKM